MGAEAEWSASYRKVAEIAVASSRARWFAVEAKATLRPATLAEVEVDDQAAGRRLIARLETWVDPAAVPIIGGGVSGDRAWLVYADPMSDPHVVVDPMGSQDVVTLGLELTAVVQRARAVGLSAPPMDPRLVVHDFLSDGTFRPRSSASVPQGRPKTNASSRPRSGRPSMARSSAATRAPSAGPLARPRRCRSARRAGGAYRPSSSRRSSRR